MAVVAYLRVSTEKQFLENQREEIIRFAEKNGLSIDRWYMETVSGKVSSKERKLAGLLDRMKPGDSLIITEISRLSVSDCSTTSCVFDFLLRCTPL